MSINKYKITPETQSQPAIAYPAYYVEVDPESKSTDDTVLLAIHVIIRDNFIEWFDTVKYRRFIYDNITRNDIGALSFINQKTGTRYNLTPLTLDLYNEKVSDRMYGSLKKFDSNESLWNELSLTRKGD